MPGGSSPPLPRAFRRERALDQPQRRPDFPELIGDDPEEVQRIGVIRIFLQRFAV